MNAPLPDQPPRPGDECILDFDRLEDDGGASAPLPFGDETEGRVTASGPLPGERASVRITHVSHHHPRAWGEAHPDVRHARRGEALPCPHAAPLGGACGGCPWMHVPVEQRIAELKTRTRALLAGLPGASTPITAHPAPLHFGWRNRTNLLPFRDAGGRIHLGARARGGAAMAPMRGCLVLPAPLRHLADAIEDLLRSADLPLATEGSAGLRWLSLRALDEGALITWRHDLPPGAARDRLLALATEAHGRLRPHGTRIRHHAAPPNRIHGGTVTHTLGAPTGTLQLGGLRHRIDDETFFQLNLPVAEQMVALALDHVGAGAPLWDVFSGVGAFGLAWALRHEAPVHGLESNPASLALAAARASELGLPFHAHEVDLFGGDQGALNALPRPAGMIVDPPRSGLRGPLAQQLIDAGAARIVHIACGQEAFARDVRRWQGAGYHLQGVHVFELLPMTGHGERVALLRKGS